MINHLDANGDLKKSKLKEFWEVTFMNCLASQNEDSNPIVVTPTLKWATGLNLILITVARSERLELPTF